MPFTAPRVVPFQPVPIADHEAPFHIASDAESVAPDADA
jgi:hypothetical protein